LGKRKSQVWCSDGSGIKELENFPRQLNLLKKGVPDVEGLIRDPFSAFSFLIHYSKNRNEAAAIEKYMGTARL
jgi:hypothetical protein